MVSGFHLIAFALFVILLFSYLRLEEEERFQKTLGDYQEREREKRQRALDEEKEKMASANMGIEQLRKVI